MPALAYVIEPGSFGCRDYCVRVELQGALTRGETVVDTEGVVTGNALSTSPALEVDANVVADLWVEPG